MGYISDEDLYRLALPLEKSEYGRYLMGLLEDGFSGWVPRFVVEERGG